MTGRAGWRRARWRRWTPALSAVPRDRNGRPEHHSAADGRAPDRLHAREHLANVALLALCAVPAQVGVQAADAETGGSGEVQRAGHVEALRDHDGVLHAEDLA